MSRSGIILVLSTLCPFGPAEGQSYSIVGDEIVITDKDHWANWQFINGSEFDLGGEFIGFTDDAFLGDITQVDVIEIADDGRIGPGFIRKSSEVIIDGVPRIVSGINSALDARYFIYNDNVQGSQGRNRGMVHGGTGDAGSGLSTGFTFISKDASARVNARWSADGKIGGVEAEYISQVLLKLLDGELDSSDKEDLKEKIPDFDNELGDLERVINGLGDKVTGVSSLMDDDMDTWWGPDPEDDMAKWWIELDLGRLVHAKRIVVKFVEEEQGDPFKQFQVLASSGEKAFPQTPQSMLLDYRLVGSTTKPSEDQRVFEFDLKPLAPRTLDFEGAAIHYIRILATDSDFGKVQKIDEDTWLSLPPEERGDREFFRRSASGVERRLSEIEYNELPDKRKGRIDYFRREMPRIAEVEVWSVGDNIGLGIEKRGGRIELTGAGAPDKAFDGLHVSELILHVFSAFTFSGGKPQGILTVDLGTLMWVDQLNIITGDNQFNNLGLDGYENLASDGSLGPDRRLLWKRISSDYRLDLEGGNLLSATRITDKLEPQKIRLFQLKNLDVTGDRSGQYNAAASLAEFQVFGEGFAPDLTLRSGFIDLGDPKNLAQIEWDADISPSTEIELSTRTGEKITQIFHYFNRDNITEYEDIPGGLTAKEQYEKARRKGRIEIENVLEGWSPWSIPYKLSGDLPPKPILSPSPRRRLQIQVRLLTDDPYARAFLNSIKVKFGPPIADELTGEIGIIVDDGVYAKPQKVSPLEPSDLSYFIRSKMRSGSLGFRDITLEGTSSLDPVMVRTGRIRTDRVAVSLLQNGEVTTIPTSNTDFLKNLSFVRTTENDSLFASVPDDSLAVLSTTSINRDDTLSVTDLESIIFDQTFKDLGDNDILINATNDTIRRLPSKVSSLLLRLPSDLRIKRPTQLGWDAFVEVQFRIRAVLNPSTFLATVGDLDFSQRVERDKDATKLVSGQSSLVSVSLIDELIQAVSIEPEIVTPNGDGINDEMSIKFTVLQINVQRGVEVEVHDLSGRRVRTLLPDSDRSITSGDYDIRWRGEDDFLSLVLPGIYVLRITVNSDTGHNSVSRVVGVAY